MKLSSIRSSCLYGLLLFWLSSMCLSSDNPDIIFGDSNLENDVVTALGLAAAPLRQSDIELLTQFNGNYHSYTSLSGLEYAVNLTYLELSGCGVTDLSPLGGLPLLRTLSMRDCGISNLSDVLSITTLRYLDLRNNDIVNLPPMASLTSLQNLLLGHNSIADISSIASFSSFSNLDLGYNQIESLDSLSGLNSVEYLILSGNYLDLSAGSDDKVQVDAWISGGATVETDPQYSRYSAPVIIREPGDTVTLDGGNGVWLEVEATDSDDNESLVYQWFSGVSGDESSPVANSDSRMIMVSPVDNAGFWVKVSNAAGFAASRTVAVTVSDCFFTGLGDLPGGITWSEPRGVDATGTLVVGNSRNESGYEPVKWTMSGGLTKLQEENEASQNDFITASAITPDGQWIAGRSLNNSGWRVGTIWNAETNAIERTTGFMQGGLSWDMSALISLSDDVSVGYGWGYHLASGANRTFRWTAAEGAQALGTFPGFYESQEQYPSMATPDGSKVVGDISGYTLADTSFQGRAFLWEQGAGFTDLGTLPGGSSSSADVISPDGSTILGASNSEYDGFDGFVWTAAEGMQSIGKPMSFYQFSPSGLTSDGVILGNAASNYGPMTQAVATNWRPYVYNAHYFTPLQMALEALGLDLSGWTLMTADMNAAGTALWGRAINPQGEEEGWLANIPDGSLAAAGASPCDIIIEAQPVGYAVKPGDSIILQTVVSTQSGATFQWYKNGSAIPGATGYVYAVPGARSADAGDYYCRITSADGQKSVDTLIATMSIDPVLTRDGNFANDLAEWSFWSQSETSDASGWTWENEFFVLINDPGEQVWEIQLQQENLYLEQGHSYHLTFTASSNVDQTMPISLMELGGSYSTYFGASVPLTATPTEFSYDFTMNHASDPLTLLNFSFGLMTGQISVHSIVLTLKPLDPVLTRNGDFSNELSEWNFWYTADVAEASCWVEDRTANIYIQQAGSENWQIQLIQSNYSLEQGKTYLMQFTASGDFSGEISAALAMDGGSFQTYGRKTVTADSTPTVYRLVIPMTAPSDPAARLSFDLGLATGLVYISQVSVSEYLSGNDMIITAPDGWSVWKTSNDETIAWVADNRDRVNLEYSIDAGARWMTIASDLNAADGTYRWTTPVTPTDELTFRLTDASNPSFSAVSNPMSLVDPNPLQVYLFTKGSGSIGVNPDKTYYSVGDTVEFTALPAEGYWFAGWGGAAHSAVNPLSMTLEGSPYLTAEFRPVKTRDQAWDYGPRLGDDLSVAYPHHMKLVYAVVALIDKPAEMSLSEIEAYLQGVHDTYQENSYYRENVLFELIPEVLVLNLTEAQAKSQYGSGYQMRGLVYDAIDSWIASSNDRDQYDYLRADGMIMQIPSIWGNNKGVSGASVIVAEGINSNSAIVPHEITHYLGLPHSSSWQPSGDTPDGPGMHLEYGGFDAFRGTHINLFHKYFLGWIPQTQITQVTTPGTYRIYRHDLIDAAGNLGITIQRGDSTSLWVEVLRKVDEYDSLGTGAIVRASYGFPDKNFPSRVHMLDMHPDTVGGNLNINDDWPLQVGDSYFDQRSGITLSMTAEGGGVEDAWVDIMVSFNDPVEAPVIQSVSQAPVIDGVAEALWDDAGELPLGNLLLESPSLDLNDFSGRAKVLYDSAKLYVFVEVTDPERKIDSGSISWNDDAIELYFDGDLSAGYGSDGNHSGYDGIDDYQIRFRLPHDMILNAAASSSNLGDFTEYAMVDHGGGYTLEVSFELSALGIVDLVPGSTHLGFEVMAIDRDSAKEQYTETNKRAWYAMTDQAWFNPAIFGRLVFGEMESGSAFDDFMAEYTSLTGDQRLGAADPDDDGIPNYLEYLLDGGNPVMRTLLPVPLVNEANNTITIIWPLRDGVDPALLTCLVCDDLAAGNWSDAGETANTSVTQEGRYMIISMPSSLVSRFVRFVAVIGDNEGSGGSVPSGYATIPGGNFTMGDSLGDGDTDELPLHDVTLTTFQIGRTEVTFRQLCEVLQWAYGQDLLTVSSSGVSNTIGETRELVNLDEAYSLISWNGDSFLVETGFEDHPAGEMTWYGAVAYCNYLSLKEGLTPCYDMSNWSCDFTAGGYRLPTEAEWEFAARGGLTGNRFPWGDSVSHTEANYYSAGDYIYDLNPVSEYHPDWFRGAGQFPFSSRVGSFTPNAYGLYDMAGNVWEWCHDGYHSSYYNSNMTPGENPTGWDAADKKIFRGGSWGNWAVDLRVAGRNNSLPDFSGSGLGFRVVRR